MKDIFMRNYGVIAPFEQTRLENAKVTVVGAGGVGGIALISLARMGVGHIQVIDMDTFEFSNINRQMLSGIQRVGKSKAASARETLLDINPNLNVTVVSEKLIEENAQDYFYQSDVVIDATDNLVSRVIIHRAAQKMGVPSVWIAVTPPFRGGVMTFSGNTPPYEQVLGHPSFQKNLTEEVQAQIHAIKNERAKNSVAHGALKEWADSYIAGQAPWAVLCPVANMVGLLASFEAFKIIVNRENLLPVYAPNLIKIDLSQPGMVTVEKPEQGYWDNGQL